MKLTLDLKDRVDKYFDKLSPQQALQLLEKYRIKSKLNYRLKSSNK